ncbi:MAG TPA: YihA family ribosome biogenesis GTP-binding protein [Firmicutes bacterium]|jgi:GTP-binding protein|nr:YihA family ribosome biogenesis GTP-binding protein [Bacillota bacterium]
MRIKKAEFFRFADSCADFPSEFYPEIVLAGRSNVGKSSFINALTGQKRLARISGTPGKTRAVHFYLINESFCFVDLPGYGYARVSKKMKEKWANLLEHYFTERKTLFMVIQIVDLRHEPSREDQQMAVWIRHFALPFITVATKADKVPRGKREKQRRIIAAALDLSPDELIIFSAETKEGKEETLQVIFRSLKEAGFSVQA